MPLYASLTSAAQDSAPKTPEAQDLAPEARPASADRGV